ALPHRFFRSRHPYSTGHRGVYRRPDRSSDFGGGKRGDKTNPGGPDSPHQYLDFGAFLFRDSWLYFLADDGFHPRSPRRRLPPGDDWSAGFRAVELDFASIDWAVVVAVENPFQFVENELLKISKQLLGSAL